MEKQAVTSAVLKSGWGYWDTTHYPYGGCFKRATADTPVTIIESFPKEKKVKFADGRVGVANVRALTVSEQR